MFRHAVILVDNWNLVWKKDPMRHVWFLVFWLCRCGSALSMLQESSPITRQLLIILKCVLPSSGTENTRFQRFASHYHFISKWVHKGPFLNPMLCFGKLFKKNCVCLAVVVSWGRVWLQKWRFYQKRRYVSLVVFLILNLQGRELPYCKC